MEVGYLRQISNRIGNTGAICLRVVDETTTCVYFWRENIYYGTNFTWSDYERRDRGDHGGVDGDAKGAEIAEPHYREWTPTKERLRFGAEGWGTNW